MQYLLLVILAFALAVLQILIGGASLAYALPAYCLVAVAGLGALAYPGRRECARTRLACVLSALVLAAYLALRSGLSPIDYLARPDFCLILAASVVYLLTAVHLSGSRQRLGIVWLLFFIALLHIVVGAVQFKRQDDWMLLPWIFRPVYFFRASGFYLSPNHLCGLLEMLAMMLLSVCIWGRGPFAMRAFAAYGFLTCLGGITLTSSRTGYLATFLAMLVFMGISLAFIYRTRRREFWNLTLMASIAFGVVMGTALFFMIRSEALSNRLEHLSTASHARLLHWPAALQQFQQNRDFGTGSGTYQIYGRLFREGTPAYDPTHVYNDYLELLAEYGLVGALLLCVFLAVHFGAGTIGLQRVILRKLRHGSRTKSNEMALLTGAVCGTTAIAVHSFTDYNLHLPANALFAAFLFGIMANPTAESVATQTLGAHRWLRFVAPTVALLLLVAAWPRVSGEYLVERARIAARSGEHAAVITFVERALQRGHAHPDLPFHRGEAQSRLAQQTRNPDERTALLRTALASFHEGVKAFPQEPRLWLGVARTHDALGEFAPAEAAFLRAFALEPASADAYADYGRHWQLQNHQAKADACFERERLLRGVAKPPPQKRQPAASPDPQQRSPADLANERPPGSIPEQPAAPRPLPAFKP